MVHGVADGHRAGHDHGGAEPAVERLRRSARSAATVSGCSRSRTCRWRLGRRWAIRSGSALAARRGSPQRAGGARRTTVWPPTTCGRENWPGTWAPRPTSTTCRRRGRSSSARRCRWAVNCTSWANLKGEIRLLCIDAKTGSVAWTQQLAVVEQEREAVQDPFRRLAGVSPSYADGVLVCPTSNRSVVAVDLATRSLLWGYVYKPSGNG